MGIWEVYEMFQVGDQVVYGVHGVCIVMATENRMIDRKQRTYLVLEPAGQDGSRFLLPTHNDAVMSKLRPIQTRETLEKLLTSEQIREMNWIRDDNARKQIYREVIGSGGPVGLMQMVYSLYQFRTQQNAVGKKLHQCDENFLRDAERLLSGEISIVLKMQPDEARFYLREKLNCV